MFASVCASSIRDAAGKIIGMSKVARAYDGLAKSEYGSGTRELCVVQYPTGVLSTGGGEGVRNALRMPLMGSLFFMPGFPIGFNSTTKTASSFMIEVAA